MGSYGGAAGSPVQSLNPRDVILGHVGSELERAENEPLHELVRARQVEYTTCKDQKKKNEIEWQVVESVTKLGGRFLVPAEFPGGLQGSYQIADMDVVLDQVKQLLCRKGIPLKRKFASCSDDPPSKKKRRGSSNEGGSRSSSSGVNSLKLHDVVLDRLSRLDSVVVSRYDELVRSRFTEYIWCTDKTRKKEIVWEVVDGVTELGGRFLLSSKFSSESKGLWEIADTSIVLEKVKWSLAGYPRQRKIASSSSSSDGSDDSDDSSNIMDRGTIRSIRCNNEVPSTVTFCARDAVPKRLPEWPHNELATTTASAANRQYRMTTDNSHAIATEAAIVSMDSDSAMECIENGEALLMNPSISPTPSNGSSDEAAALDNPVDSTLVVDDQSSSVLVHSPGRLVLNCIMHGFTGYGVMAFFLTVNWYVNGKGK
jgi:hypothetical protein